MTGEELWMRNQGFEMNSSEGGMQKNEEMKYDGVRRIKRISRGILSESSGEMRRG